jgi:DNA-binding HxlR family transcriptional regulator
MDWYWAIVLVMAGSNPDRRSECPIASSLDILGDKWTLLVVRDLLDGKTRFSQFERSPEGIPTNILSDRLRRLEAAGLLGRARGAASGRMEYHPTVAARSLRPVLLALASWGNENLEGTWVPPAGYLIGPSEEP